MNSARATGVAAYSRALFEAAGLAGFAPIGLCEEAPFLERHGWPGPARLQRWLQGLGAGVRPLRAADDDQRLWLGEAIFRLAQVHFNARGRLFRLRPLTPNGIMHWAYPVPLCMEGWINVYTVHDAIPLNMPELSPIDPQRHLRLLRRIADRADKLVTVSQAARRDIVKALRCEPSLVVDCGQSVAPVAAQNALPSGLAAGGYFLFVGSVEPRKNLVTLANAYRASGTTFPLLIVGPDGWRAEDVARRIGFDDRVRRMPYQDAGALGTLIANARAVLFPSLAEGFGRPVAEAMALGTPVLTARGGALEETAGGAALLVDPADQLGMASAIAALASDDRLCAQLSLAGRRRARAFSPEQFADRLGLLYAELADARES